MTPPAQITMTLERGLHVLRAFRAERTPLTNSEIVKRTGLPKATVSRLTTTLIALGFLRRVAGSTQFELAPASLHIGDTYLETNPVTDRVHPFLYHVAAARMQSVLQARVPAWPPALPEGHRARNGVCGAAQAPAPGLKR